MESFTSNGCTACACFSHSSGNIINCTFVPMDFYVAEHRITAVKNLEQLAGIHGWPAQILLRAVHAGGTLANKHIAAIAACDLKIKNLDKSHAERLREEPTLDKSINEALADMHCLRSRIRERLASIEVAATRLRTQAGLLLGEIRRKLYLLECAMLCPCCAEEKRGIYDILVGQEERVRRMYDSGNIWRDYALGRGLHDLQILVGFITDIDARQDEYASKLVSLRSAAGLGA